jgi:molecular chaperone GrpE
MSKEREIEKLRKELEEAKKESIEHLNGWKRAKADYLNREKEINREKVDWVKFSNLELILKILPILDAFDQSLKQIPDDLKENKWTKGVFQIKQQLEDFLKIQGVGKIKSVEEKFNPDFHEVVEKRGEGGKIIEEIQAGYLMNNEVIRAAKVIIK